MAYLLGQAAWAGGDGNPPRRAVVIPIAGHVDRVMERSVQRRIEEARRIHADLIIFRIESRSAGRPSSYLAIARQIAEVRFARTVAFLPRDTEQGNALLAFVCEEVFAVPGITMGQIGTLALEHQNPGPDVEQVTQRVLMRFVPRVARRNGRSPGLIEAMIEPNLTIYAYTNTTTDNRQVKYFRDTDPQVLDNPNTWQKGPELPESTKRGYLQVDTNRAEALRLINASVENQNELQQLLEIKSPPHQLSATFLDRAAVVLNNWMVSAVILFLGCIALYFAINMPGLGFPEIIAALCFLLFFWSHWLDGSAGWLEIILFAMGFGLILLEIFVIPGFGIPGITGLLMMLTSLILACHHFIIPTTGFEITQLLRTSGVVLFCFLIMIGLTGAFQGRLDRLPMFNRFALAPPESVSTASSSTVAGTSSEGPSDHQAEAAPLSLGDQGLAETPLRPSGRARFGEQKVDVVAEGEFVSKGQAVQVIQVTGNRVVVRPVPSAS